MHPYTDQPDSRQMEIFRGMTPAQRFGLAMKLRADARSIKTAALRSFHPDWPEEKIRRTVREVFLYG